MRHHHHGHSLGSNIFHQLQHLSNHLRVQCRSWLIEEEHLGIHRQGSGDCHTLFLSARKTVGIAVCLVQQSDTGQEFRCLLIGFFPCHLAQFYRSQHDIATNGHIREEIELLEHHAHSLAHLVDVYIPGSDIHTVDIDFTFGRFLQKIDGAQESTLSATRWTDNGYNLAFLHRGCYAFQYLVVAEAFTKSFYLDYFVHFIHCFIFHSFSAVSPAFSRQHSVRERG